MSKLYETAAGLPAKNAPGGTGPLSNLSICFQAADEAGCGGYRCILPVGQMRTYGAHATWTRRMTHQDYDKHNILVFQRPMEEGLCHEMRELSRLGKLVLVEVDDNLHEIPQSSPVYDQYKGDKTKGFTEALKTADGLIVSTPEIAKTYYKYNRNIVVTPNSIDRTLGFRDWSGKNDETGKKPGEVVVGWRGGICFDNTTEVLTKNGFKLFKDLSPEESVATINQDTHQIEYQHPTDYITVDYKGEMHVVQTEQISYCVTPNHWIYASKDGKEYETKQSKDLFGTSFYLKKDALWEGVYRELYTIPGTEGTTDNTISMDRWLQFFGKWLADGWAYKSMESDCGQVGIYHHNNSELLSLLAEHMDSFGYSVCWRPGKEQWAIYHNALYRHLKTFGNYKQRFIPKEIKNLDAGQLVILLNWYLSGQSDFKDFFNEELQSYVDSKQLADDLVEIALKVGWSANVTKSQDYYVVTFIQNNTLNNLRPFIDKDCQSKINYEGKVYCVTVPNHTLYVRRNGLSHWSGNTHQADLLLMTNLIKRMFKKYDNVRLALYSAEELCYWSVVQWGIQEYRDRITVIKPRKFVDYPRGLGGIDILLIPLVPGKFNDAKSELALCEAGALKIPTVCSASAAYSRFAGTNNEYAYAGGIHKNEVPLSETTCLDKLIENESERKALGEKAYQRVLSNYDLEKNVFNWATACIEIQNQKNHGNTGPGENLEAKKISKECPCPYCLESDIKNPPKFKKCKKHWGTK